MNQGSSIAVPEQQRIFERHYRGKEVRPDTRGSGLGLHGSKKLAQALGGDIRVQSREGIGTRFQGLFPVAEQGGIVNP